MTLDELKIQRLEIERQIRAIENNLAVTENFVVSRETKTRIALKFRLSSNSKNARGIMSFTERCFPGENGPENELVKTCESLIEQLESIKEQIKK